jgi:hypothetical protein
MRLALTLIALLLVPAQAAGAAELSLELETEGGIRYGTPHEASGKLTGDDGAPLAGQRVELEARVFPFDIPYDVVATAVTAADGSFAFAHRFDRNARLRVSAPDQGERSKLAHAYVFPHVELTFKPLARGRLRLIQTLTTPRDVKLSAPSIFYLAPAKAKRGSEVARAEPKRMRRGRFRATATVSLPGSFDGRFQYAACFRYSGGSGMGDPKVGCPEKYRF